MRTDKHPKPAPNPAAPPPSRPWALAVLPLAAAALWAHYHWVEVSWGVFSTAAKAMVPRLFPFTLEAAVLHGVRLLGLAWLGLSFWGAGSFLVRRLSLPWRDPFERAAIGLGLGLGVVSYALFGLGLAGLLHPAAVHLLLAALAALGFAGRKPGEGLGGASLPPDRGARSRPLNPGWRGFFSCLLAAAGVGVLPLVLAPETFWDALVYHLNMPSLYLVERRMVPTPANLFSGNVLSVQMLYAAALSVGGPAVAKTLNAALGLGHALFFASWARRWNRPGAGLLASAVFFLCPLVLYETYRLSVGMGWSFFQLCAFHAIVSACDFPEGSSERRRWWVLAGIFLGLAMSTKYPAWSALAAPALALGLSRVKRLGLPRIALAEAGLAAALALAVLCPWLARNAAFYGDPVFPYLTSASAPCGDGLRPGAGRSCVLPEREGKGWKALNKDARSRDLKAVFTTAQGFLRWLVHPWTFSTRVANREADFIGPAFLVFLPLALLGPGTPASLLLLAALALGAWLPLSLAAEMPRFFMPELAPLAFLAAFGVLRVGPAWPRNILLALAAWLLAGNALQTFHPPPSIADAWDVVSGRRSEDDYLRHAIQGLYPNPPFPAIEHLNAHTEAWEKILMVGDSRGLYLERGFFASGQFDAAILERLFNCGGGPEEVRRRLLSCGVTHILVNRAEIYRLRQDFRLTDAGLLSLERFWRDCTEKVFESYAPPSDHWVAVFRIVKAGEKPDPRKFEPILIGPSRPAAPARR